MAKKSPAVVGVVQPGGDSKPSAALRRPSSLVDIDSFEAVMMREDCDTGFFVSFDFTEDAFAEIGAFFKRTGKIIKAFTVRDILDEAKLGMKLA